MGGEGVKETSRLVVDRLKGNVFINQYLIIKDLGKGAHGTVKLVYNTQDDLLYAMKVIHKRRMRRQSYLAEPRAVASMLRGSPLAAHAEGQRSPLASPRAGAATAGMTDEYSNEIAVMKELDHPNLVKLYEVIHDPSNNKLLMTMEYVEGGYVLIANSGNDKVPIPEDTAVKYFRDVVKGLEYLHFNRIVHGDLKPDNLLMSSSGNVKISDFGSARFCEKSDTIFATAGTPIFMAPEMCQGKPFNGFPGDIWALGICLYMFIFGKPPFTGQGTYQVYEAIQNNELTFPPDIPASAQLKDLLGRLLSKDPVPRAALEDVKIHPWVTCSGALPALQSSAERAVQRVFEAMRLRTNEGGRKAAPITTPLSAVLDIRKLCPDAEVHTFHDKEVIIKQGQAPEGLYYVQEGFVDLIYMPSEKKLVADEDFADAISDEDGEGQEQEEVEIIRRSSMAGLPVPMPSSRPDADAVRRSREAAEPGGSSSSGGEDDARAEDFMALFSTQLSDRMSPVAGARSHATSYSTPRQYGSATHGDKGGGTPRNQSYIVHVPRASPPQSPSRQPPLSPVRQTAPLSPSRLSYSGVTVPPTATTPSPLGLSMVSAAGPDVEARTSANSGRSSRNQVLFQSPFAMVSGSPSCSPAASRRQLAQEMSFNPRNNVPQPRSYKSFASGTSHSLSGNEATTAPGAGTPGTSFVPSASNPRSFFTNMRNSKLWRGSRAADQDPATEDPLALPHDLAHIRTSIGGTPGNASVADSHTPTPQGTPPSAPSRWLLMRDGGSRRASQGTMQSLHSTTGSAAPIPEELAELNGPGSRRLSVTTGGGGSFHKLSRANSAAGSARHPLDSGLPTPEADSGAGSGDSLISNADITMQPGGDGASGWRHERPTPILVGAAGTGLGPAILPLPSMPRHMNELRRSVTHDQLIIPPERGSSMGGMPGAPSTSAVLPTSPTHGVSSAPLNRPPLTTTTSVGAGGLVSGTAEPLQRVRNTGRVRRHSTSSPNTFLGKLMGLQPIDPTTIQEWSTTSKLAQKAITRSDSMHSRMAQMVMRARQSGVRKRRNSMQLVTTRGPGSVVGELCIDSKPSRSNAAVVAKGPVTLLLIRNEKVNKYRNQPSVMAALHRSQNASLVQEAMERFVECEQEVTAVEIIRRSITTDPMVMLMPGDNVTGEVIAEDEECEHHERSDMPSTMADVYTGNS